jgi:DNA-directed RNA polymerase specialized sigma24 family protein
MQNREFDLDVTFEEQTPDLSHLDAAALEREIANLPAALQPVARGILVEKRTMSDVSQDLGIRQAVLVRELHRASVAIAAATA